MKIGFVDADGTTGKHPVGWDVISYFQNSPIVHVFLVFGDTVYETSETTYGTRTLSSRLAGSKCHLFEVEGLTEEDEANAKKYCDSVVGTFYDYPGVMFLGLMLLAERLSNLVAWPIRWLFAKANNKPIEWIRIAFINNPYHLSDAYFCSEAVYNAMKKTSVKMPEWWFGENVLPYQVYRYCLDNPHVFEVVE